SSTPNSPRRRGPGIPCSSATSRPPSPIRSRWPNARWPEPSPRDAASGDPTMKLCHFNAGLDRPLFLIAGPCVIESAELAFDTAGRLKEITDRLGIPFIYKSSFDKANRSSGKSFRGPGFEAGLRILADVRDRIGVPVLTDV